MYAKMIDGKIVGLAKYKGSGGCSKKVEHKSDLVLAFLKQQEDAIYDYTESRGALKAKLKAGTASGAEVQHILAALI